MFILNDAVLPLYHAVLLNRIGFDHQHIHRYFHDSPYSFAIKMSMENAGLKFIMPDALEASNGSQSPPEIKK